jgi:hypothetical protein
MISINNESEWRSYLKVIKAKFIDNDVTLGKLSRKKYDKNGVYEEIVIQEGINLIYRPRSQEFMITSSTSYGGELYKLDVFQKKIKLFREVMKDVTL